jgi:PAS domain S-box-containing protein
VDHLAFPEHRESYLNTALIVGRVCGLAVSRARAAERMAAAQQALAVEREWLAVTLHGIGDGVIATDTEGRVTLMNPVAQALTGWSEDEARGRPLEEVFPIVDEGTGHRCENPALKALATRAVQEMANGTVLVARDGKERVIADSAAPILAQDGLVIGAVLVFRDVSENHRAARERERLLAEVQRRAAQQEEFISVVSHDLRAPLTSVQGNAQLLQRVADNPEMVSRSAGAIYTSAQRMNRIIQDLVDSTRLESGQLVLHLTPVDVASFTVDLKERMAGVMDTERLSIEMMEVPPPALADPDRLERILTNLISNALKYSTDEVVVKVEGFEEGVKVSVADHGPGIPPRDLPHLFERFFRVEGTRKKEGLGLGLYITRMLVEAHGGRIWVESEVGGGSVFSFILPMLRED